MGRVCDVCGDVGFGGGVSQEDVEALQVRGRGDAAAAEVLESRETLERRRWWWAGEVRRGEGEERQDGRFGIR